MQEFPSNLFIEDDAMSESSVTDLSRFIPRMPMSPSPLAHVVSIGQLMESVKFLLISLITNHMHFTCWMDQYNDLGVCVSQALEVAGQVAGTSVSTSPLPYSTMASQCEALGTDTRKKLSNWLTQDNHCTKASDLTLVPNPAHGISAINRVSVLPSIHPFIHSFPKAYDHNRCSYS